MAGPGSDFEAPKLTALAVKYSHPVGEDHFNLDGSRELKSGLTPLDYGPFKTRDQFKNLQRWEAYQRRRFRGTPRTLLLLIFSVGLAWTIFWRCVYKLETDVE